MDRKTTPYLTKYERARVLGTRSMQLSIGAVPTVETNGETDPLKIAEKELLEGRMPIKIRRPLPSGQFEEWSVSELIL